VKARRERNGAAESTAPFFIPDVGFPRFRMSEVGRFWAIAGTGFLAQIQHFA